MINFQNNRRDMFSTAIRIYTVIGTLIPNMRLSTTHCEYLLLFMCEK